MEQVFRRVGISLIVLGAHVLLILLLISQRTLKDRERFPTPSAPTVLLLLDDNWQRQPPLSQAIPEYVITSKWRTPWVQPRNQAPEAITNSLVIAPPTSEITPQTDWSREAEIAISAMAPNVLEELQSRCDEAKRTNASPPPGCEKRSYEADWKPESRVPVIHLSRRCVIGPGYFGCLPEPDGTLFDDRNDPNRPHSSVPDIKAEAAAAKRPAPVVVRDKN